MKIAAITPTRGDRPQFVEHCKYLMQQQTRRPDKHYIIDYPPINNNCDLIPRIKKGIELAKADGMDYIFIIEDDDYYSTDYIREEVKHYDIVGEDTTIYYHLKNGFKLMEHPNRSSLFCTAFKINALNNFNWPPDNEPFLDLHLWQYAINSLNHNLHYITGAIGIKHGIGKCGGNGHNPQIIHYTPKPITELITCKKSIEFYNSLTPCTPNK